MRQPGKDISGYFFIEYVQDYGRRHARPLARVHSDEPAAAADFPTMDTIGEASSGFTDWHLRMSSEA